MSPIDWLNVWLAWFGSKNIFSKTLVKAAVIEKPVFDKNASIIEPKSVQIILADLVWVIGMWLAKGQFFVLPYGSLEGFNQ